ncbi:MAG: GDSL-type esterase/lipase family protein, partial [Pseudomonadota bacterium]|nr:GDSL-type esterase/lipase family protein [Pseudomonadota bacterium]
MTIRLWRNALCAILGLGAMISTSAIAAEARWAGAWGYAAASADPGDARLPSGTFRYRIEITQSGDQLMLTLTNPDTRDSLAIGPVTVARAAGRDTDSAIASMRRVTFAKQNALNIGPGRAAISDAVAFPVKVGDNLIVSIALTSGSHPRGTDLALPVLFVPARDATGEAQPAGGRTIKVRPFLSLVSVRNPASTCTIVALGDSITDGALSKSPTERGWPGRLAARFADQPANQRCGVVNLGISGNGVLRTIVGDAVLDRFWRDVAAVPGVTHIVFLEGINDIGTSHLGTVPPLEAESLVAGYRQLIARAHALGIKVISGTLTPALHAGYMSPDKERLRLAVNDFVRTSGEYDAVVDFDAAVRDPASPSDLQSAFDTG